MQNIKQTRNDVYQRLKFWDSKRAQILKHHKKSIQQILQYLDKRISDAKQYVENLQNLLEYRINQLKSVSTNSLMNSHYVLQKNKADAYKAHYDVLKCLIGIQAAESQQNQNKLAAITSIHRDLGQSIEQLPGQQLGESPCKKLEGSSISLTKSNINYLIEYQLQQIVQNVLKLGEIVSNSFNNVKNQKLDLYVSMLFFVHQTHKQSAKHREIGRQVITLTAQTMKAELKIQHKIRKCLKSWNKIDGPVDEQFIEEMTNADVSTMMQKYYDLNQISNLQFDQPSIQDFLINLQVDSFTGHEKLCLCAIQAYYDNKIETIVLITSDNYVHLQRMNSPKPDFSFILNTELQFEKKKPHCVKIMQNKKWMYFKKQVQFQFLLEFHREEDFSLFKALIEKNSQCRIK